MWIKIKAFLVGIVQFLKNKNGQFAMEELGKAVALALAAYLAYAFFFGTMLDAARPYFPQFELMLLGFAGITGAVSNITHE